MNLRFAGLSGHSAANECICRMSMEALAVETIGALRRSTDRGSGRSKRLQTEDVNLPFAAPRRSAANADEASSRRASPEDPFSSDMVLCSQTHPILSRIEAESSTEAVART